MKILISALTAGLIAWNIYYIVQPVSAQIAAVFTPVVSIAPALGAP
jgi:hypothetical protein